MGRLITYRESQTWHLRMGLKSDCATGELKSTAPTFSHIGLRSSKPGGFVQHWGSGADTHIVQRVSAAPLLHDT